MKSLIAYYSRADENYFSGKIKNIEKGNTERAAEILKEITGADMFKIEQKVPYAADYDTCVAQARKDMSEGARPELVSCPENISEYDTIYLGYPNYCGTMPMAVYTFLESFDWSGKTICPFCTHEGSGLSNTEKDIMGAAKNAVVKKGLAINGSNLDRAEKAFRQWVR